MTIPLADTRREIERFLLGENPTLTRVDVAEQAGVPLDVAIELWRHLGFPHHADDDVAFTPADVEALRKAHDLMLMGVLSDDSRAALVRTWGRSFARLAEWQAALLAEVASSHGDLQAGLTALAEETLPRVEALQDYVWRRHIASAADRLLGDTPQLGELEVTTTVCFVDIVGFTARSRTLEPIELVGWVEDFEREATGLVIDHGGQVIKTIGDEVLFTVDDPAEALAVAMELTRLGEDPATVVPRVRAGLAHGHVVRRLGDVFGSTVNAASRLTSLARPGTVVVDRGVHDALQDDPDLRWRRLRRVSAKGLPDLEAWRVRSPRGGEDTAEA